MCSVSFRPYHSSFARSAWHTEPLFLTEMHSIAQNDKKKSDDDQKFSYQTVFLFKSNESTFLLSKSCRPAIVHPRKSSNEELDNSLLPVSLRKDQLCSLGYRKFKSILINFFRFKILQIWCDWPFESRQCVGKHLADGRLILGRVLTGPSFGIQDEELKKIEDDHLNIISIMNRQS